MSEVKRKCCATVHNDYSFRGSPCSNNAKIEHEGEWYCGTHSPLLKQKRRDEWNAKFDREQKRRNELAAQERRERERADACVSACEGIPNPSNFVRAARELERTCTVLADMRACLAFADEADENDTCMKCYACGIDWTVREVRVMQEKQSGACQCGKWEFDHGKALSAFNAAGGGE